MLGTLYRWFEPVILLPVFTVFLVREVCRSVVLALDETVLVSKKIRRATHPSLER